MRSTALFALALLALAGCRTTRIEVETLVHPNGGATRTITILSEDDGEPAEHPEDLAQAPPGYALRTDVLGERVLQAELQALDAAQGGFGFRSGVAARTAGSSVRFRATDWILFRILRYAERIEDVVDPDEVKEVLDEAAAATAALLEDSFRRVFGADFEGTVLRKRLRDDLRGMLREAAFIGWQELSRSGTPKGVGERFARRIHGLLKRHGFEISWPQFEAWVDAGGDPAELPEVRRALAVWLAGELQPRAEGLRVPVVPDPEAVLFGGAFAAAFDQAVSARYGSKKEMEVHAESLWKRVFGVFGPDRQDVRFHLRVKMPGKLLRSNGYLRDDGWTFVEFPAGAAYPDGQGLECESVVWEPAALGALPAPIVPDNQAALDWTWVFGDGPQGRPDPTLEPVLRQCLAARALEPLEEFAADPQTRPEHAQRAGRILDWLGGGRD